MNDFPLVGQTADIKLPFARFVAELGDGKAMQVWVREAPRKGDLRFTSDYVGQDGSCQTSGEYRRAQD